MTKAVQMTKTVPATLSSSAPVSPAPSRNRTFAPDGAGGWREVTTMEEKRAVARRIMLAAYGLMDHASTDYGLTDRTLTQTKKAPVAVSAASGGASKEFC